MQVWDAFLDQLEQDLGKGTVDKWLRSLVIQRFDACNLYLEAKDSFHIMWFEEHIRARVRERFCNNNGNPIRVHLSVANENVEEVSKKVAKEKAAKAKERLTITFEEWDPHCRFDNFVDSKASMLPYRVLSELAGVAERPLELAIFNPVYIWGPSGTGKTHLLTATAKALQERGLKVRYAHADTFTEHVVAAIRAGEMHRFRQSYRDVDVLIVDDVQIFSRKRATQEEFFHTFNTLHVGGKQIVLSADCAPGDLQVVEPRLVSRFEWGIVLPMEKPDKDCQRQILLNKAEELGVPLTEAVVEFFMKQFSSKTKSLVRALEALILRTHLNSSSRKDLSGLSLAEVEVCLQDLVDEERKKKTTPEQIISTVAEFYGMRKEDILSKSQSRDCVTPRKIAMHLCRELLNLPFMKIGGIFERDHSTVMSSVKQIKKAVDNNVSDIAAPVTNISRQLQVR